MIWTKKYSPKKVSEVVGQNKPVEQFTLWYQNWKPGKKAALFTGPPGVGKTCLAEALATENNLEVIELNASDYRTSLQIKEVIGQSMKQRSLFKRGKIFLIDEIDGISGREDRGGPGEIIKIIEESKFPIILTANDKWNIKLSKLKTHCQLIDFGKINFWGMIKRLEEICQRENVKCSKDILKQLAKRSEGDLRSAINDLDTLSKGKSEILIKDKIKIFRAYLSGRQISELIVDPEGDVGYSWLNPNIGSCSSVPRASIVTRVNGYLVIYGKKCDPVLESMPFMRVKFKGKYHEYLETVPIIGC